MAGDVVHPVPAASLGPEARARRVADIERRRVHWLWPGRIPLAKLTLLSGDPGLGKSMVSAALAATVSRGGRWPIEGEGRAPGGDVVMVSAEDDPADTIRPRLEAAGADLSRVHVLDAVDDVDRDGEPVSRPWSLQDLDALEELLGQLDAPRLVIVDPLSAFLAGVDTRANADVRALLHPVSELAARRGVAVVGVSHLNKSEGPAIYRTTGSIAFVAAARAAYAVSKDQDDPARRLVVPIKTNLAPDRTGLAYRIGTASDGTARVEWESEAVEMTASEALAPAPSSEEHTATDEAKSFLREMLAAGPMPAKDVQRQAKEAGITEKPLRNARTRLGIRPRKREFSGGWEWALPEDDHHEDDQPPTSPKSSSNRNPHEGDSDDSEAPHSAQDDHGVIKGEL